MWRSKRFSPLVLVFLLTVTFVCHSHAEVSTSDPLWDWKYDAIERLSLAFGERTVSNTRPMSRLEMARLVLRFSAGVGGLENGGDYLKTLLNRLEYDLKEEIESINNKAIEEMKVKPLRWVRAKAVHSDDPFQLENDYGFQAGELSLRGELSTSGTFGFIGYELRPQFNIYRDNQNDDQADLHSGYLVIWLKNLEIEVGKDSLWWGPGHHGSWLLTS
ncbi:MAG: capsule assembly Wzi family protein, partial [Deltaproteobacteria bacterium]